MKFIDIRGYSDLGLEEFDGMFCEVIEEKEELGEFGETLYGVLIGPEHIYAIVPDSILSDSQPITDDYRRWNRLNAWGERIDDD